MVLNIFKKRKEQDQRPQDYVPQVLTESAPGLGGFRSPGGLETPGYTMPYSGYGYGYTQPQRVPGYSNIGAGTGRLSTSLGDLATQLDLSGGGDKAFCVDESEQGGISLFGKRRKC